MSFSRPGEPQDIILRSMYAESESDYLHFRYEGDVEKMELIQTPYAARVPQQAFAFLTVYRSIPPFLAAVITDLSERQTLSATVGT